MAYTYTPTPEAFKLLCELADMQRAKWPKEIIDLDRAIACAIAAMHLRLDKEMHQDTDDGVVD